ncbi:succinate dehydrogenase assembly factor 3, mitochondrial isoform X2 [Xenopus laevis]|nr:succinate dehydrogenase assembly factor 3, mitochondrial isoform X2 [Xenopus laevis]XP_018124686.1 succinate dehydrogenase assembly factor 3, mitochondrial isoform X2 [Xenopus laevis]
MASLPSHVQNVRSLYKKILVLHHMLPLHFKALGDQYVKEEFRRHKNASPQEAKLFMKEWEAYATLLWKQTNETLHSRGGKGVFGASISQETLDSFRGEQIGQLYELMQETKKHKHQFDIIEDGQK